MSPDIKPVAIGGKLVGPGQPTYIVAEKGINHNGSIEIDEELTNVAVEAGADAVKLQTRTPGLNWSKQELEKPRDVPMEMLIHAIERGCLPSESVRRLRESGYERTITDDLKRLLEFNDDELKESDRHCRAREIPWFTSCWDIASLKRTETLFPHLPAIKIASPRNQNRALLRLARDTGKPIILSTGMIRGGLDTLKEIVQYIGTENLVLLHCRSVYSTGMETDEEALKRANLRAIATLRETFRVPVGFSNHDSGIQPCYAAAVLGAAMIEAHITLKRAMYGSDQSWSTNPVDLTRLIRLIRELPLIMGDGQIKYSQDEAAAEKKLRDIQWDEG